MLVDSTRLGGLHFCDGDENVLMDLYEEEVEVFPNEGNVERVDDAADSSDEILFDERREVHRGVHRARVCDDQLDCKQHFDVRAGVSFLRVGNGSIFAPPDRPSAPM